MNTILTHPDAESYVSVAEADAHFEGDAVWCALSKIKKERYLKQATAEIDALRFHDEKLVKYNQWYRREQALEFPRSGKYKSGIARESTSNTLTDSTLADNSTIPNDLFNDGALIIYEGTGKGNTYRITDFDATTGTITIEGTMTIDTTSQYIAVEPLEKNIRYATLEQALFISSGGGIRQKLASEGVVSKRIDDLQESYSDAYVMVKDIAYSNNAMGYLRKYRSRIGIIV